MPHACPMPRRTAPRSWSAYMLERFHPRLALACSFQKEETVLLDMLLRLEPTARVFTIDTGVLFEETRTGVAPRSRSTTGSRSRSSTRGDPAVSRGPPSTAAASGRSPRSSRRLRASTAGSPGCVASRRTTRGETPKLTWDERRGVWKASPLADWTDTDVWAYIARHDLPVQRRCTTGATSRSGARRARCQEPAATGAGRDRTRPSAALHVDRRRHDDVAIGSGRSRTDSALDRIVA